MAKATRTYSAQGQTLDLRMEGSRDAVITVTGGGTATLGFQVSRDGGATWDTLGCLNTAGAVVTSATAAGRFYPLGLAPTDIVRVSTTAYTSALTAVIESR